MNDFWRNENRYTIWKCKERMTTIIQSYKEKCGDSREVKIKIILKLESLSEIENVYQNEVNKWKNSELISVRNLFKLSPKYSF